MAVFNNHSDFAWFVKMKQFSFVKLVFILNFADIKLLLASNKRNTKPQLLIIRYLYSC